MYYLTVFDWDKKKCAPKMLTKCRHILSIKILDVKKNPKLWVLFKQPVTRTVNRGPQAEINSQVNDFKY